MKTGIIIGIIVIIGIVYYVSRKNNGKQSLIQVARQIQLEELESVISQLIEHKLEYNFFGISSNGTDCIYFSENKGKINIEFEVMMNEQTSYVEKLTSFANKYKYPITKTTYGNAPNYPELKEAPVYTIELNANKEKATEVGIEIMKTIFNTDETTQFDIVP